MSCPGEVLRVLRLPQCFKYNPTEYSANGGVGFGGVFATGHSGSFHIETPRPRLPGAGGLL